MDIYASICNELHIQALIVVGSDPHQLEEPSEAFKIRHYLANFYGSAGTLLLYINKNSSKDTTHSALWTDGRYEVAAKQALNLATQLYISKEQDWTAQILWLANLHSTCSPKTNLTIHISDVQISVANFDEIEKSIGYVSKEYAFTIQLVPIEYSKLLSSVKKYYPSIAEPPSLDTSIANTSTITKALPYLQSSIWSLDSVQSLYCKYTDLAESTNLQSYKENTQSLSSAQMLSARFDKLAEFLHSINASIYFSANVHELAWLSMLRSNSLLHLMVFPCIFSFNTLNRELQVWIPTHLNNKHTHAAMTTLELHAKLRIRIHNYDSLFLPSKITTTLIQDAHTEKEVVYDKRHVPYSLICPKFRAITSPIVHWKSIRTAQEIENTKLACLFDSIAMMEAMAEIFENLTQSPTKKITEHDACDIILAHRNAQPLFLQESFRTILASGANAALPHYAGSTPSPAIDINLPLLIDSGAHYLYGTTDLTRVYHFDSLVHSSPPPSLFAKDFNAVLKAHIALATQSIPLSSNNVEPLYPQGRDIDKIARSAIKTFERNYLHGTGHGIGYCTDVHEGCQRFSETCVEEIIPNLLISNEPGYYRLGKWGIRIENMVTTVHNSKNELTFNTISYLPIQNSLINVSLFTELELLWLSNYHNHCRTLLTPHLSTKASHFLSTLLQ